MYRVQVFVSHGYFEYEVDTIERAMAHGQAIMNSGVFRNSRDDGEVEFYKPFKVKVKGEGLKSQYPATFKRT